MGGVSECYQIDTSEEEAVLIHESSSSQGDEFMDGSDLEDSFYFDEVAMTSSVPTNAPTDNVRFRSLDDQQLQKLQAKEISEASSILGLPFDLCRAIMRAYFWDRERVFEVAMDSPAKAYKASGIENLIDSPASLSFRPQRSFTCDICCDDSPSETLKLQCGHVYCLGCHRTYYEQSIREGNAKKLVCPGACNTLVQDETLKQVVSPENFAR